MTPPVLVAVYDLAPAEMRLPKATAPAKGRISATFSVFCACGQHDTFAFEQDTARACAKAAKREGWGNHKEHGWMCPDCLKNGPHL